jgi:triphosphoribosyl-dephospho-CoA synthase
MSRPVSDAPRVRTAADVAALAQLACLLEVSAPKPGNVSPGRHFADLRYEDFLTSAVAIGAPFMRVADRPLGETIRDAIETTNGWTKTNTNLGIVLLLAPLARAAVRPGARELRSSLRSVLAETTVNDAREVYAAIRCA